MMMVQVMMRMMRMNELDTFRLMKSVGVEKECEYR